MSEPFLGEMRIFGCNFAPRGWAEAHGQILPINQNQSLYSLLGTNFGGDGRTSFGLPDTRSRVVEGQNTNSSERIGTKSGAEFVGLTLAEIPYHDHAINVPVNNGVFDPTTGQTSGFLQDYSSLSGLQLYQSGSSGSSMKLAGTLTRDAGGGQEHENRQPFLAMNYCIALQGLFPSRS